MRRLMTCLALIGLPLLAACDSEAPPAKAPTAPKVTAPVAAPASRPAAALPASARPLLGTWASDLSQCGDAAQMTTISTARLEGPGRQCDMTIKEVDGGFQLDCSGTVTLIPVFAPSGEGINILVEGKKSATLLRCSR